MQGKKYSKIVTIVCIIAMCFILFLVYTFSDNEELKAEITKQVTNTITDVIITEETQELANDTIEATENNEDLSTTEVIESTEAEEETITDEGALETDAVVEQENISYDGTNSGDGQTLLGSYQGLTYYSQADSRWANVMYSSTNDSSQTMKSSACGPTSAAMVVSSSKGTILPTTMANLAVDNGYRTASSGTAWSYFPFVADYFGFNEYYTTSSFATMQSYLTQKNSDGSNKYYVIASCGSGLFTTGGHYIVLVADNSGTITVYDPYAYSGKFNTASRKVANVTVSGNSVFVSENSFKTYANYKYFWIYSNDNGSGNTATTTSTTSYTRYVATQSANLNVRNAPNGNVIGSLIKGTAVTVYEVANGWSRIGTNKWVSTSYLSASPVSIATSTSYSTSTGTLYRLKSATTLYSNSNLTGTKYNYLAQTQIKVISHVSSTVDYVYVVKTRKIRIL